MADYTNPLDSKSYINKDYNTIWVEILDLVKKISYRWDPSISNESDPGVVLAKLDAIIADKNNYNIDKNILETAPSSVAQLPDARALFDQLGYTMHWYVGGTTQLSLKFVQQTSEDSEQQELPVQVTLPRFSMVCNDDNSVVFTTTEEVILPTNGTVRTVPVIQGSKVDYTINDQELITIDYLDNENRLYFNDTNVAENGIFIKNDKQENTNSWNRVDNLTVEQLGQKVYKFGVLANSNTPYIEFPSDASDLFGDGIYITYVKTDGENGNINAKIIDRFYAYVDSPEGVTLDNDNVSMANFSAVLNGRNPESIDDAYRNYKKVTGTFNTLVTLRDYINAIYNTELVSNDFVVDRTNDLQSSYYIITNQNDVNTTKLMNGYAGNDDGLNAFNLKMCILNWIDSPTTRELFDKSFEAVDNIRTNNDSFLIDQTQQNILDMLDDLKSIQHDFVSPIADVPLFFKNRFPIECKIIPNYRLTDLQQKEVQGNIILALYNALYSRKIDFGEEVDYDKIYDIIVNADERINYVVLDDIKYGTFAVYYDDSDYKFKEILISDAEVIQARIQNNVATEFNTQTVIVPDVTKLYYNYNDFTTTPLAHLYQYIGGKFIEVPGTVDLYNGVPSTDIRENFRNDIFAKSVLTGKTQLLIPDNDFRRDIGQQYVNEQTVETISTELKINFTNVSSEQKMYRIKENEVINFIKPSLIDKVNYSAYVKYEFIAGSYNNDVNIAQNNGDVAAQQFTFEGQTKTITLDNYFGAFVNDIDFKNSLTYLPAANVDITKIFIDRTKNTITFNSDCGLGNSAYTIRYPYCTSDINSITADDIYQLGINDTIIFYWKQSDDSESYSFEKYSSPTIISPNFTLTPTVTRFGSTLQNNSGIIQDSNLNNNISKQVKTILSASKAISIKDENSAILNSANNYCYWITNNIQTSANGTRNYVLTLARTSTNDNFSYVLRNNEYFMYTNQSKNTLDILGSGTKIEFNKDVLGGTLSQDQKSIQFTCPVQEYNEIVTKGISTFTDDMWQNIHSNTLNQDFTIKVTEQEIVSLGNGTTLLVSGEQEDRYVFDEQKTIQSGVKIHESTAISTPETNQTYIFTNIDGNIQKNTVVFGLDLDGSITYDVAGYGFSVDDTEYTTSNTLKITYSIGDISGVSEVKIVLRYVAPTSETITLTNSNVNISEILNCQLQDINGSPITENLIKIDKTEIYGLDNHSIEVSVANYSDITQVKFYVIYLGYTTTTANLYLGKDITPNLTKTYSISYYDTVATNITELPKVFNDQYNILDWSAFTDLMINISKNKPQKIVDSSEGDVTSEQIIKVNDDVNKIGSNGTYLLSSEDINIQGGNNIDLRTIDIYGKISAPIIYAYMLQNNIDEDEYDVQNGVIKYVSDGSDKTFEVKLNKGNYILPIHYEFPSNEGQCSVTYDGNELDPIATGSTNYFYQIDITNDIPAQEPLTISADNNTKITIYPLFKYNKFYQQNGCNYDNVLTRLKALDKNGLYNYTYEVPEEDLVENPLSAKSFLNENHIYNKFTICQMDQNQAPQILNKVR